MGMRKFQETVQYCSLRDMKTLGPLFTWSNKRYDDELICKKLDRVMVNDKWIADNQQIYGVFEPGGCSDHLRCRIRLEAINTTTRKPFKFANILATYHYFLKMVKTYWDDTKDISFDFSNIQILEETEISEPHDKRDE